MNVPVLGLLIAHVPDFLKEHPEFIADLWTEVAALGETVHTTDAEAAYKFAEWSFCRGWISQREWVLFVQAFAAMETVHPEFFWVNHPARI